MHAMAGKVSFPCFNSSVACCIMDYKPGLEEKWTCFANKNFLPLRGPLFSQSLSMSPAALRLLHISPTVRVTACNRHHDISGVPRQQWVTVLHNFVLRDMCRTQDAGLTAIKEAIPAVTSEEDANYILMRQTRGEERRQILENERINTRKRARKNSGAW